MKLLFAILLQTFFSACVIGQDQLSKKDSVSGIVGKEYLALEELSLNNNNDQFFLKSFDKNGKRDSVSLSINNSQKSFLVAEDKYLVSTEGDTILNQKARRILFLKDSLEILVDKKRNYFRKDLKVDYIDQRTDQVISSINCKWDRKTKSYSIIVHYDASNRNSYQLSAFGIARLDKEGVISDFNSRMDPYITGALFGLFTAAAMELQ